MECLGRLCENCLCFPVLADVDEDRLRPEVNLTTPSERTGIERIFQDEMEIPFADRFTVFGTDCFTKGRKGMGTGRVQVEDPVHDGEVVRVNFDRAFCFVVPVSEGCATGKDTLRRFLAHTFLDLFFEVLGVVPRYSEADVMHQLHLRSRVFREDLALLDEMDLDIEIFESQCIPLISIETVGLLYEQHAAAAIALEPCDHLGKRPPPCGLCSLDILECLNDEHPVLLGILPQDLALSFK